MMTFTEHAKERMLKRNIREELISDSLEMFYRYGYWNERGDRLTLDTQSQNILDAIKQKKAVLSLIRSRLCLERRVLSDKSLSKIAKLKHLYKSVSKKLKTLQQLERKKVLTLIIKDGSILTVYKKEKRDRHNTTRRVHKSKGADAVTAF